MTLTGNTFFLPVEVQLMEWLQANLGKTAISIISAMSMFGEELIMILILGILYWGFHKELAKRIGSMILLSAVWNPMLKNVVIRRRPYMDHEGISILRVVEPGADIMDISAQGYSFPSGHSTSAVALFGSLAYETRKKWAWCLAVLIPVLVGISRVVVGAHYPTDVLGGWLIAIVSIAAVTRLSKKISNPVLQRGMLLLLALPGVLFCKSADYFSGLGLLIGFVTGLTVEEKWVRFENTKSILRAVLRTIVGGGLFLGLNTLLKAPFSREFLENGSMAAMAVRCARYAVISFVEFGVYPLAFRWTAKIGKHENRL